MEFDIEALQELGGATIQTSTIWTEGVQSFTGVPMKTLVAEFGLTSGSLRASAINDYAIDFPVEDAMKDGPMIAYHRNGKPMTVRDKGPLWIVFPFDSDPKFQTEVVHARSIWQLDRIEILD